jgi:hypothetical protein
MKAVLKSIEKGVSRFDGKTPIVEFTCEVEKKDGSKEIVSGSYSEKYARDYFAYCNVKTKDLVGKEVEVSLDIHYMNVLDSDGKPIRMPKKANNELDF